MLFAYAAGAELGFLLASATRQVTAIWPPSGIALTAMLLVGKRAWLPVWAAAFFVNVTNHETWSVAMCIATGNTLGPLLGARVLRRAGFDASLGSIRDVLLLVAAGAVGAMTLTALNGATWLAMFGLVPWSRYLSVLWVWWVGDAMGVLIVAPLLLTWFTPRAIAWSWNRPRAIECCCLFALLAVTCRVVFFDVLPLSYAVFPLAAWAALRFGQRETTCVVFVVAAAAVWGVSRELGPFAGGQRERELIYLALFMGVMAITVLLLGAAIGERAQAKQALQATLDELERRVAERTLALGSANTSLQHANAELERRSQELNAKQREVESFVYVVSHDLRAPLVNLHGFSAELQASCSELEAVIERSSAIDSDKRALRQIVSEQITQALHFITNSTRKLQRLIDALLVLSRTGREQYAFEPIDMNLLVSATAEVLRQSLAASGASLQLHPLPAVFADQTAVGQVVSNLIGNAIKYLRRGVTGVIEVGGEQQDDMCHLWVRDNGSGIAANAQPRLFQVFQRFHPHMAQGEGMGLVIVKRVVERHGGRVWAQSAEGVGSTFHFTLPAEHNRRMTSWPRPT